MYFSESEKYKCKKYSHIVVIGVDGAGHSNGYGTENHIKAINEVDKLIGDVHSAVKGAGNHEYWRCDGAAEDMAHRN